MSQTGQIIEEVIKAQEDNSLTVNYNRWIFDNIKAYVGNRVIDIGAGKGNFLGFLSERDLVLATDILDVFIDDLRKLYADYRNIHILKYDIQDEEFIQIANKFDIDTVICNNVLEHAHDDLKALHNMRKMFNRSGNLILVLPAFGFLYSRWDKSIGHFRRYDFKDIENKLIKAKFTIRANFYMNIIGFFGWFLNGRVLKNTPKTGCLIEEQAVFFDRYIVKALRKIERVFPPPFGLSLIVIAEAQTQLGL